MVTIAKQQVLAPDGGGFLTGVTGMLIGAGSGGPLLYLATSYGAGVSAYTIASNGNLTLSGTRTYAGSSGGIAAPNLISVPIAGAPVLLPIGTYDQQLTAYGLATDGTLNGKKAAVLSAGSALPTATAHTVPVTVGSATYLYTAHSGAAAPVGYAISGTAALTPVAATVGAGAAEGTITTLGALDIGSAHVLLAGFSGHDRLTSYTISGSGQLTQAASLGAAEGLSITTPSALATAELGGHSYAILAAAGTSTLSVVEVGADGHLTATDQVLDDLNTRFAGADLVTAVAQGGHEFVFAAGSDDGISMFALLPGGRLAYLASIADTAELTLAQVAAIAALAQGNTIDLYANSQSEAGLSVLKVDLSGFGEILEASSGQLTGTAKEDILIAHSGNLSLRGGDGADLFIFERHGALADGKLGTVLDFTPGTDRIDLSDLPMLYGAGQVTVTATAQGAKLSFGGYWLDVHAAVPGPLAASAFTTANLLNVTHQPVTSDTAHAENPNPSTPAGVTITGSSGADNISGGGGNDDLYGGGGNDTIAGLDGNDTIHAGDGADRVIGGLGDDLIYGGGSSADGGDYIDAGAGNNSVDGGAGNDTILADAGADILVGGVGDDSINAGDGADTLRGGDGADTLIGGGGNDSILGGDSTADLRDVIYGGAGSDTIDGGWGNDSISGDDGQDSLDGGFGADTLIGNSGNDTLSGGPLSDLLYGGPGADFLNGGYGYDRLNGGPGSDRFYHLGTASQGTDWVQDYNAGEGDVLVFGDSHASADQFQVNFAETSGAGQAGVAEALVIYKPTGQILWALVDGADQPHIELQIAGSSVLHDLLI